jgi:hypothetical protein
MATTSFEVMCPCCQTRLTIDASLGAVVGHQAPPPKRTTESLGTAFDSLLKQSAERETRFQKQMEAERQKGKLLDRKFQEGLKRAKDSPDPPPRPFDHD